MTESTPQILPEKPGEPGGEKARAREEVITHAIVLENLGIFVDWIKVAERLAKVEAMYGCSGTSR